MSCMARQLQFSSCSSSSSAAFSRCAFHRETFCYSRKFTVSPRRIHSLNWVSGVCDKIQQRKHFELMSSNGYSLNAVSLQDGELCFLALLTAIIIICFCYFVCVCVGLHFFFLSKLGLVQLVVYCFIWFRSYGEVPSLIYDFLSSI